MKRVIIITLCLSLCALIITLCFAAQNTEDLTCLHLRMVGTAIYKGKITTLLEDAENGIEGFFEEGDSIAGYKIKSISEKGVTLTANGQDFFIKIFNTEVIPVLTSVDISTLNIEKVDKKDEIKTKREISTISPGKVVDIFKNYYLEMPPEAPAKKFVIPLKGILRSSFGERLNPMGGEDKFHNGWDISLKYGAEIRASADGVVELARYYGSLGRSVFINHKNNYQTRYGHLSKTLVKPGQYVKQGDLIGLEGSTGCSTGPHLHFEIRWQNRCVDPTVFFNIPDLSFR